MVSNNLSWNHKPSNDLIEQEKCCGFMIISECRHGFCPLSEVVNHHYDVLMPLRRGWVEYHKIYPHLVKGLKVMIENIGAGCACIFFVNI
jgi:hypothetical protein